MEFCHLCCIKIGSVILVISLFALLCSFYFRFSAVFSCCMLLIFFGGGGRGACHVSRVCGLFGVFSHL